MSTSQQAHDSRMDTRPLQAKLRSLPHRQLNSIRFPLPYELLARIFHFSCPPIDFTKRSLCEFYDDEILNPFDSERDEYPLQMNKHDLSHRYMPLTLSAVSRCWREVAFSSPELWSTFALKVFCWKLGSQVPLLRLYLKNTGSLPFSLDLDIRIQQGAYVGGYGKTAPIIEWRSLQSLADVIFYEFPEKIQTMRMAGAPPGWMYLLTQHNLPHLRDLTFAWGGYLGDRTTISIEKGCFTIQPIELRRIHGATFRPRPMESGLPPLTTLHLRNVYMNICAAMLLSCPYLVEYHCYSPSKNDQPLSVTFQHPFTAPNLKNFGYVLTDDDSYSNIINGTFLKNIRLPNLEELHWGVLPYSEEEAAMLPFFSNLPKALHSFTFHGCEYYWPEYNKQFLSRLPSFQSLVFYQCLATFTGKILYLLCNRTPGMLPSLNTISVRNCQGRGKGGIGKALVGVLKKRGRLLGTSDFTFEAEDCKVRWSRSTQNKGELFSVRTEGVLDPYFTSRDLASFSKVNP